MKFMKRIIVILLVLSAGRLLYAQERNQIGVDGWGVRAAYNNALELPSGAPGWLAGGGLHWKRTYDKGCLDVRGAVDYIFLDDRVTNPAYVTMDFYGEVDLKAGWSWNIPVLEGHWLWRAGLALGVNGALCGKGMGTPELYYRAGHWLCSAEAQTDITYRNGRVQVGVEANLPLLTGGYSPYYQYYPLTQEEWNRYISTPNVLAWVSDYVYFTGSVYGMYEVWQGKAGSCWLRVAYRYQRLYSCLHDLVERKQKHVLSVGVAFRF